MTDIEAAERVLAQLSDQKDRASEQVRKIAERRQVLAYAVLARNDKKAQDELVESPNQQLADLAVTIGDIDCAVVEARRRLDAAKAGWRANRTPAKSGASTSTSCCSALQECAPPLDVSWGHVEIGQAGGRRIVVGPKNGKLAARNNSDAAVWFIPLPRTSWQVSVNMKEQPAVIRCGLLSPRRVAHSSLRCPRWPKPSVGAGYSLHERDQLCQSAASAYDRRYGCAQAQPAHAAQPRLQLQAVRRLAQTLARDGNARRGAAISSCISSRAARASVTAIGS